MLITFVLMLGMAAVAKPMIITLIGAKWEPCVIYLQMLCFVGMLYPLHAINLNMLTVKGRSDLFCDWKSLKDIGYSCYNHSSYLWDNCYDWRDDFTFFDCLLS